MFAGSEIRPFSAQRQVGKVLGIRTIHIQTLRLILVTIFQKSHSGPVFATSSLFTFLVEIWSLLDYMP